MKAPLCPPIAQPGAPLRRDEGFTLVEMLVSLGIMMVVMAGVFTVFNPAQGAFRTQPEVADLQQRLRLAVAEITDGLRNAGSGSYRGQGLGPLNAVVAPILPYRIGSANADLPTQYRTDAITAIRVPADAAESTAASAIGATTADIVVATDTGCPPGPPACGFEVGDRVLLFADNGLYDIFSVTGITGGNALQHTSDPLSRTYPAGVQLVEVATDTYYLSSPADGSAPQLMHYDGYETEEAIVDNVVGLRFEYLGDPAPAALVRNPAEALGPWTTYGPKPPVIGIDNTGDTWQAGENCLFQVVAGQQVPRLTSLGAGSLGLLTEAQLKNGPWCPDEASARRFAANLLRIRTVRVTLRLQTGVAGLRGTDPALFARPGVGNDSTRMVPDQQIRFDVSPRNVNLDR